MTLLVGQEFDLLSNNTHFSMNSTRDPDLKFFSYDSDLFSLQKYFTIERLKIENKGFYVLSLLSELNHKHS